MKVAGNLALLGSLALLPLCIAGASAPPAAKAGSGAADLSAGREIFANNCASCHGAGIGNPGLERKPGTDALYAKYKGEIPAELEKRTDLTPEMVAYFVRNGVSVMPFYRKTEINDTQLAQLGAYLSRNNKDLAK